MMNNAPFPFIFLYMLPHKFCLYSCYIGILEYDEWAHHRQAWKLESAAIIEPPINFIVSSHSKGKRRCNTLVVSPFSSNSTYMLLAFVPDNVIPFQA